MQVTTAVDQTPGRRRLAKFPISCRAFRIEVFPEPFLPIMIVMS